MIFADADPTTGVTGYLFTQGVLGVVLVVLGVAFIYYYRTTQKKLDAKDDKIMEIMEARRVEVADTVKEVTTVLSSNSQAMQILSEKIAVGKAQGN